MKPVRGHKGERATKVLIEASSDVVPIEAIGKNPSGDQILLQSKRDGCLASPKQPSDPDGAASKPTSSPCPGHLMVLGKHIFGFLLLKIFHIRLRNYKVLCNQINTIIKNILRMFWPPIKLKLFYFFMFNMLSK